MKKWVISFICIVIVVSAAIGYYLRPEAAQVTGQQPETLLKPGTYRVEFDQPDGRGWTPFLEMSVNNAGEIEVVTFDYESTTGALKTQDTDYNARMKVVSGLGPSEYCPRFAKNLIIYQEPDKVDGITGATSSSREFKQLAQAAYDAAKAGLQATTYISHSEEAH